jgi:hypothetical protein
MQVFEQPPRQQRAATRGTEQDFILALAVRGQRRAIQRNAEAVDDTVRTQHPRRHHVGVRCRVEHGLHRDDEACLRHRVAVEQQNRIDRGIGKR